MKTTVKTPTKRAYKKKKNHKPSVKLNNWQVKKDDETIDSDLWEYMNEAEDIKL